MRVFKVPRASFFYLTTIAAKEIVNKSVAISFIAFHAPVSEEIGKSPQTPSLECLSLFESRNGPLQWIKFLFTSRNKSLLLFVALTELFRDSAKICRGVKVAPLGERGLESCAFRCC